MVSYPCCSDTKMTASPSKAFGKNGVSSQAGSLQNGHGRCVRKNVSGEHPSFSITPPWCATNSLTPHSQAPPQRTQERNARNARSDLAMAVSFRQRVSLSLSIFNMHVMPSIVLEPAPCKYVPFFSQTGTGRLNGAGGKKTALPGRYGFQQTKPFRRCGFPPPFHLRFSNAHNVRHPEPRLFRLRTSEESLMACKVGMP